MEWLRFLSGLSIALLKSLAKAVYDISAAWTVLSELATHPSSRDQI